MARIFTFPTVSEALPVLAKYLLTYGEEVGSRNGRVKELLNTQIVITDPQRREVLTLNRKANVFAQIAETMWILAGRNDIEWLSAYLPRAKEFSDDGKTWRGGYGPRLRGTGANQIDQIAYVLDVLSADPLSRRAVVAIYDPRQDIPAGKDVPCNDFLQFQSRNGALHMTVTVRSNDLMWGWSGINAFEWSTLQEIMAHLLGITVGTLTFNIGSLHLYDRHWSKASRLEFEDVPHVITPFRMPAHTELSLDWIDVMVDRWFAWEGMCRDGQATPDLLKDFEEPLFRSWAAAIAYFWQREDHWLQMLHGTALGVAVARTPASVLPEPVQTSRSAAAGQGHPTHLRERVRAFYRFVKDLHATKHASYGDSWKKRGEKMSILANMARKVDRLGVGDEFDSSADTMIDLLVYTIKYECWLTDRDDGPEMVNILLAHYLVETTECWGQAADIAIVDIVGDFNTYCDNVDTYSDEQKVEFVRELARRVAPIARDLWHEEEREEEHDGDDYRGADVD